MKSSRKLLLFFVSATLLIGLVLLGSLVSCSGSPPTLELNIGAPSPYQPGQEIGITLIVKNLPPNPKYIWTVEAGEIVKGEGTPAITYRTPQKPGDYNVSVRVEWDGGSEKKETIIPVDEPQPPPPTDTPTSTPIIDPTDTPTSTPTMTATIIRPTDTPTPEPPTATPTLTITVAPPPPPIYGATAEETLDILRNSGIISFGIRFDAPRYGEDPNWSDTKCDPTGDHTGFDPQGFDREIIKALVKHWGVSEDAIKLRCVRLGDRGPTIKAAVGGIRIGVFVFSYLPYRCNPADPRGVLCSKRYMSDGLGVIAIADNSAITTLCDVDGKKVGVVRDSSAEFNFAGGADALCTFETQPEIILFKDRKEAIDALLSGDVDVYATNREILKGVVDNYNTDNDNSNNLKLVSGEFGQEETVIAMTPGETGLRELINLTLQAMKQDGTLDALIGTHFLCAIPPIDITVSDHPLIKELISNDSPNNPCDINGATPEPGQALCALTSDREYTVQADDNLGRISRLCLGNFKLWPCIARENGITDSKIYVDQMIKIPILDKATCPELDTE